MRRLALSFVGLIIAVAGQPAQAQLKERFSCPSSNPQRLAFEATTIEFDSVLRAITDNRSEAINCLQIVGAKHEYLVELVGSNLSNVWTRDGGYLAQNDPFVVRPTQFESTDLYVGPNREKFDVKVLKEKTKLGMVVDSIVTWIIASLPTRRADPEKSLRSVSFRFDAINKGDVIAFEFVDQDSSGSPFTFRIADSTKPGIADLQGKLFQIGKAVNGTAYRVPSGPKAIQPTRIEFIDSDHLILAAMDLYLLVPAAGQQ